MGDGGGGWAARAKGRAASAASVRLGGGATRHTPRAPTQCLPITLCCVLSLRMHVHQDVFLNTTVGSQLSLTYSVWEFVVVGRVPASKSGFNLVENLGGRRPGLPASWGKRPVILSY